MRKKDCKVGLRVGPKVTEYYEGEDPFPGTVVAGDAPPGHVLVEWDLHDYQIRAGQTPTAQAVLVKDLLPFKEAKAKFSKLEDEFTAYEKQVEAKLKEAAKLVRQADRISRKAGVDGLRDMYNATYPLLNAMDDVGWRTSSLGC